MRVCLQGLRRSMGGSSPISSHFRLVVRLRRACFSADSSSPENSTFPTALASCCHPKRLAMDERRFERSATFGRLAADLEALADCLAAIPLQELRPYRAAAE